MNPDVARILDANGNRAAEAARVIEDHARFACDDKALAARLKQLRHDLANTLATLGLRDLLTHRDTPGDVGTAVTTAAEYQRATAGDVVAAACKRLTQALRVLEEYAKTANCNAAKQFEQLRYAAYDIESVVLLRADLRGRMAAARLYVLITESFCKADWLATAEAVLTGGADCLQLREKGLSDKDLLARAQSLTDLAHRHNSLCIVNDRPDIARLAGADGVHVGQDDLSVQAARRIVGADRLVGISTHSVSQIEAAAEACPDYLAVGPMFTSGTKPEASRETSAGELARAAVERFVGPVVAIGGITTVNAVEVMGYGVGCVAVCGAVIGADDPEAAARALRGALMA